MSRKLSFTVLDQMDNLVKPQAWAQMEIVEWSDLVTGREGRDIALVNDCYSPIEERARRTGGLLPTSTGTGEEFVINPQLKLQRYRLLLTLSHTNVDTPRSGDRHG